MNNIYAYDYRPTHDGLLILARAVRDRIELRVTTDSVGYIGRPQVHGSIYNDVLREFSDIHGRAPIGPMTVSSIDQVSYRVSDFNFIDSMLQQPLTIAYNIETLSTTPRFSNPDNPEDQIYIITASVLNGIKLAFVQHDIRDVPMDFEIRGYQDERSLLEGFVSWLYQLSPDILIGFNNRHFSDSFIRTRWKMYDESRDWKPDRTISLDVYRYLRLFGESLYGHFENYRLSTIAKKLLGREKRDPEYVILQRAYEDPESHLDDYLRGIDRSMNDVYLIEDLWNLNMMDNLSEISRSIFDTPSELMNVRFSEWPGYTLNRDVFRLTETNNNRMLKNRVVRVNTYSPEATVISFDRLVQRCILESLEEYSTNRLLIQQVSRLIERTSRVSIVIQFMISNLFNNVSPMVADGVNERIYNIFNRVTELVRYPILLLDVDYLIVVIPFNQSISSIALGGQSFIPPRTLGENFTTDILWNPSTSLNLPILSREYITEEYHDRVHELVTELNDGEILVNSRTHAGGVLIDSYIGYWSGRRNSFAEVDVYFITYHDGQFSYRIDDRRRWRQFYLLHGTKMRYAIDLLTTGRSIIPMPVIDDLSQVRMLDHDASKIGMRSSYIVATEGRYLPISNASLEDVDVPYYLNKIRDQISIPTMFTT